MRSLLGKRGGGTTLVVAMTLVVIGCGGHAGSTRSSKTARAAATTTTTTYPAPNLPSPTDPAGSTTTMPSANHAVPSNTARTTVTTPAVVPPPADQQAALARLLAGYPAHSYATSTILHTGNLSYVAVARDVGPLRSVIDIDVYEASQFVPVAVNLGATQNLDPVNPGGIQTADITGAQFPDFLVLLAAGDHVNGVLVSFAGGSWHLVGTDDRTGAAASDELVQPQVIGNQVTQAVNDCAPDCAQGTYTVTTYRFDPGSGKLAAVGPSVQSATP